jgi:hypothetical protein
MTCKVCKTFAWFVLCASLLAFVVLLLSLVAGCVRRPGQSYPYVSQSYAEGDVVYQGVGVRF